MADHTSMTTSDSENFPDCTEKLPGLSTSFTISFEDDEDNSANKLKKNKSSNMFIRRHIRTLSLPTDRDRHSPGDISDLRDATNKNRSIVHLDERNDDLPISVVPSINGSVTNTLHHTDSSIPVDSFNLTEPADDDTSSKRSSNDDANSNDSEGGTYTLDKNNRQVLLARKSIDRVFGIVTNDEISSGTSAEKLCNKSKMIDEWMEQSVTAMEFDGATSRRPPITSNAISKSKQYVSKIPSPMVRRRVLSSEIATAEVSNSKSLSSCVEKKTFQTSAEIKTNVKLRNSSSSEEIDTKSYLKETENIVVALQNRLQEELVPNKSTNGLEKETNKYANTRFNRAFSLRRDKSKKVLPATNTTAIPVRKKTITTTTGSKNRHTSDFSEFSRQNERRTSFSRDASKPKKLPVSTLTNAVTTKNDHSSKKPVYQRLKSNNSGIRSNSSLSAQEIEFQNWKRRKNYDPLKAAAEDRKKKAMQSSTTCVSSSAALSTEKEKSAMKKKGSEFHDQVIQRSASFHGLRNKNKFGRCTSIENNDLMHSADDRFVSSACFSNENSLSSGITDYDYDNDDWSIPKPPSTSLQNTPPESVCSRLSLLSNPPSCSSAFHSSSPLSKMNLATLASVTQLSHDIKISVFSLNNCLRSDKDKVGVFTTKGKGSAAKTEDVDSNHSLPDQEYDLCRNGVHYNGTSNDLSDYNDFEQHSVDHQLKLTLDNLRQICIAVEELQTVCSTK